MDGLDNIYIADTIRRFSSDFQGVYSSDNIPLNLLTLDKFIIVCNLSKQKEKGTHFVTIVAHPNETLYIDSIGLPCTNEQICNFLFQRGRPLIYNSRTVQHPLSVFCGYYCIFYTLLFDSNNINVKDTFYFSSVNLYANDKRCMKYIKMLMRYNK